MFSGHIREVSSPHCFVDLVSAMVNSGYFLRDWSQGRKLHELM